MYVRLVGVLIVLLYGAVQLAGCGAGAVAVGGYLAYEHSQPKTEYTLNVTLDTAYSELQSYFQKQSIKVAGNQQSYQLNLTEGDHQVILAITKDASSDKNSLLRLVPNSGEGASDDDKKADLKWGDEQLEAACKSLSWSCKGK